MGTLSFFLAHPHTTPSSPTYYGDLNETRFTVHVPTFNTKTRFET